MANGTPGSGTADRAAAWPEQQRAAHYREQAARFDLMAGEESRVVTRDRLLDLARQYRGLAASLEARTAPKAP